MSGLHLHHPKAILGAAAFAIAVAGVTVGALLWIDTGQDARAATTSQGAQSEQSGGPGSVFQQAILADGQVTEAEYTQSRLKVNDCMSAAGIQPTALDDPQMQNANFGWTLPYGSDVEAAGDVVRQCERDYFSAVDAQYRLDNAGPQVSPDVRAKEVAQCLAGKGVQAAPPFDAETVRRLMSNSENHQAFVDCENARSGQ